MQILERIRAQRPEYDWNSPQLKHLDFMYASLGDGLYWACESQGAVDKIAATKRLQLWRAAPPDNTRAWTPRAITPTRAAGTG